MLLKDASDLSKNEVILKVSWNLLYFSYHKNCEKYELLHWKVWETFGGVHKKGRHFIIYTFLYYVTLLHVSNNFSF